MGEDACREVAALIARVVDAPHEESVVAEVSDRVDDLADAYILYG